MKLQEACEKLNKLAWIKFKDLFSSADMEEIIVNKGKTGQLLELALGMKLSSADLDFEDGELKTNKCDANGKPRETVFITQISAMIDELLAQKKFEDTKLYKKISNILYVPVCKDGTPDNWMFLPSIHVDLSDPKYSGQMANIYKCAVKTRKTEVENITQFIPIPTGAMFQTKTMLFILRKNSWRTFARLLE